MVLYAHVEQTCAYSEGTHNGKPFLRRRAAHIIKTVIFHLDEPNCPPVRKGATFIGSRTQPWGVTPAACSCPNLYYSNLLFHTVVSDLK